MDNETRQALELFVEKAEKLSDGEFSQFIASTSLQLNINWTAQEPLNVELTTPKEGASDALILTLRFFIQERDGINILKVNKFEQDSSLSQNWCAHFQDTRQKLQKIMDSSPNNVGFQFGTEKLTAQTVMETFLYGEMAHAKKDKRERYLQWKNREGTWFPMLQHAFNIILVEVLVAVCWIAHVTKLELQGAEVPPLTDDYCHQVVRQPRLQEWCKLEFEQI